jgi:uncharacterized protein YbaR (Trm112 family)
MSGRIDPELLNILVCPKCRGKLEVRSNAEGVESSLLCHPCGLAYPIEDGIPVMLLEEAELLGRDVG